MATARKQEPVRLQACRRSAPGLAPMHLREEALVIALRAVLAEYPKFISYGGDL